MNTAHNNDILRHFDASEPSSDLGRNLNASSVLQVHLWRFVYDEHIDEIRVLRSGSRFERGAPQFELVVPGIISFRMRAVRTYALS